MNFSTEQSFYEGNTLEQTPFQDEIEAATPEILINTEVKNGVKKDFFLSSFVQQIKFKINMFDVNSIIHIFMFQVK